MDYVGRADRSAHLIEVTAHDWMANDDVIPPAVACHADLDASQVVDLQEVFRHVATIGCPRDLCQGFQEGIPRHPDVCQRGLREDAWQL